MLRVDIRVRPGASKTGVGGAIGGRLQVRVHEQAVDGNATAAALKAVAEAFGLRPSAVRLISGPTSRDKTVELEGDDSVLQARLAVLTEQ